VALNRGLRLAKQAYVWIFDDDDVADPAALERLYQALAARPDCGFAYGLCDRFTGPWPAPTTPPYRAYGSAQRAPLYIRLLEEHFIWQGALLVRRRCYEEVGAFNASLLRSQDYEMVLRLAARFEGVAVPHILFHQRQHSGLRGPSKLKLKATELLDSWKSFDQIVLRAIHESHELGEFLSVPPQADLALREQMTALIQRGAIMARAGAWDLASADMLAAAERARQTAALSLNSQEMSALRRIFERWARSAFSSAAEGRNFFAAIDAFEPARLRNAIKAALVWPVLYRVKKLLRDDERTAQARELALILRCAGPAALVHAVAQRKLRAEPLVVPINAGQVNLRSSAFRSSHPQGAE
ncbi:MAG: glycosyltransferase, partial [Acidobacteriaceae bacterium]|nr:glycosyltransferase [Acidobacteriaceae bacterium]